SHGNTTHLWAAWPADVCENVFESTAGEHVRPGKACVPLHQLPKEALHIRDVVVGPEFNRQAAKGIASGNEIDESCWTGFQMAPRRWTDDDESQLVIMLGLRKGLAAELRKGLAAELSLRTSKSGSQGKSSITCGCQITRSRR